MASGVGGVSHQVDPLFIVEESVEPEHVRVLEPTLGGGVLGGC